MRKLAILAFVVASFIAFGTRMGSAQEQRLSSASAEFRGFYGKFIAAVHSGNKATVASMTSFPLIYNFGGEDAGKATKKEFFDSGFQRMFGRAPSKFMTEKNPVITSSSDTSYIVSTKGSTRLIFTKGGKGFFFTDYLVEP